MTLSRTLFPTIVLLAGVAAAQQPPMPSTPRPAVAPRALPARPALPDDDVDRPTPRPAVAPRAVTTLEDFDEATPRPARPPRAVLAQLPEPPAPPATPRPSPAPRAVPAPAIAGDFPDGFDFDQDRIRELKDKAFEMQEKFDFKFDFDLQDKLALANEKAMELRNMKFPMAFAPQVGVGVGVGVGKGRQMMSDDRAYESGQRALEGRRYPEALEYFNQVASRAGNRADGALYWKAYTLIRLGRADEARAAIAELRKSYASSRWLDDAKALEVEAGKPISPENESDEELKLIALNGLMNSDPDRALPLLDGLLKSAQPPKIKKQAVYVLAQSNSPKAQQMLEQVARGQGNPDLQLSAIRYLGERRRQGGSNPVLGEIYSSTSDENVKRAILNAFESARDKDHLLQIAKSEKQQDLRLHAIRLLSSIPGTQSDMWALYQSETTPEGKQQILESIPSTGNLDKLLEVARTEKEPKLRRFAIQNLGTPRAASTGDTLVGIYAGEQDQDVKRAIIDALAGQKNVKAIIQCARAEKDNRMQQRILERLISMRSPEANDYLMEIIKK